MLVGRPHIIDDIGDALAGDVPVIHVTWEKNSEDIVHYIRSSIRKSRVLKRISLNLQNEIVETLSNGANGMFMWVDLMLRELNSKSRENAIRESLKLAPRGLVEMLRHVLQRFSVTLKDEEPGDLNTLLAFVCCAPSPLSLGQLDMIMKLKSPTGDSVIYLEGRLRKQFASFFTLTREDGLSTGDLQLQQPVWPSEGEDSLEKEEDGMDDLDVEADFDSNKTTTEVSFCHASIGDFLRDPAQGKVSAGDDFPAIGVDIKDAKLQVLDTCLDLICDDSTRKKIGNDPGMLGYARTNWIGHLQKLDLAALTTEEKVSIGKRLSKMLQEPDVIWEWAQAASHVFFSESNVSFLSALLQDKDLIENLVKDDQAWVQSALQSSAGIFLPLATLISKKWLQGLYFNHTSCFAVVHVITQLPKAPAACFPASAKDIIKAAKWSNLEENALWHRRLAMVLRDLCYYDDAVEHFEITLKLDPTLWLARGGIAKVHAAKGDFKKAIEIEKETVPILESSKNPLDKGSVYTVVTNVAGWYQNLGDRASAFEWNLKAFNLWNKAYACAIYCIVYLHKEKRFTEVMSMLKEMEEKEQNGDQTRLTGCLWSDNSDDSDFTRAAASAARETGQLVFLQDAYGAAIVAARKSLRTVVAAALEHCLAVIHYRYGQNDEQAIHLWERIYSIHASSRAETEMSYIQIKAALALATAYFQKACKATGNSEEIDKYVKKLEKLSKQKNSLSNANTTWISTRETSVVLGIWYCRNGQESKAQDCFRVYIKHCLQILGDDDPDNDEDGWYMLAAVLLASGDDMNAVAVYHALGRYKMEDVKDDGEIGKENQRQEGEEAGRENAGLGEKQTGKVGGENKEVGVGEEEVEPRVAGEEEAPAAGDEVGKPLSTSEVDDENEVYDPVWTCDGPCAVEFFIYDGSHVCRSCYNINFCDLCNNLRLEDAIPFRICSPQHETLKIPPCAAKDLGFKELMVGDKVVGVDEWKNNLKKQWQM